MTNIEEIAPSIHIAHIAYEHRRKDEKLECDIALLGRAFRKHFLFVLTH